MSRNGIIVTGIIAIVLVVAGVLALTKKSNNSSSSTTPTTSTSQSTTQTTPATNSTQSGSNTDQTSSGSTITYDGSSFSPSTLTVKAGTTITIKNTSGELSFNSDPHPTHTDNTELNVGIVSSGQSKTFTVNNKGTWGYHNHEDPTQRGTIIVQ